MFTLTRTNFSKLTSLVQSGFRFVCSLLLAHHRLQWPELRRKFALWVCASVCSNSWSVNTNAVKRMLSFLANVCVHSLKFRQIDMQWARREMIYTYFICATWQAQPVCYIKSKVVAHVAVEISTVRTVHVDNFFFFHFPQLQRRVTALIRVNYKIIVIKIAMKNFLRNLAKSDNFRID